MAENTGHAPRTIPIPDIVFRSVDSKVYPEFPQGMTYDLQSLHIPYELKNMMDLIREWYPRLREMLWTDEELSTDTIIHIEFRERDGNQPEHKGAIARITRNNELIIYDRYLKKIKASAADSEQKISGGGLIHELTHMIQARFRVHDRRPRWMSEALADYFRYSVFEAYVFDKFLAKTRKEMINHVIQDQFKASTCNMSGRDFTCADFEHRGYSFYKKPIHAAGMLVMMEHRHPGLVKKIHRKLFDSVVNKYDFFDKEISDFLLVETGKDLEKNWCEYIALVDGKSEEEATLHCYPEDSWFYGLFW
ncbi:hypothetical protein [Sansalvadorimonas verongulae]|uniref:hypothetical protein n=1 Tax=Sansalvadorimonas verongulae TaxID=2172824 RepID=UPI001E60811B|nr:hypothetical protein [Sansalvadorimonas verongulae]